MACRKMTSNIADRLAGREKRLIRACVGATRPTAILELYGTRLPRQLLSRAVVVVSRPELPQAVQIIGQDIAVPIR
jgi:hypothetical protein